jgi:hypothetical protein
VINPAAVLPAEMLAAARTCAATAPPLTPRQRDLLTDMIGPVVSDLRAEQLAAAAR